MTSPGIDADGVAVLAQPIVDLASGEICKHELTLQLPADLAMKADDLLIGHALTIAGYGDPVAVDVSSASLGYPDFAARAERAVIEARVDPSLLTFEVTEAGLTSNPATASAFVQRVHDLGCAVTVDHCGKGHTGFGYLKRLPVDCLKIDATFIADLHPASSDEQLVRAVACLATGFGMSVAADGVPDAAVRVLLEDLGVDQAQGAYFGAPSALLGGRPGPPLMAAGLPA